MVTLVWTRSGRRPTWLTLIFAVLFLGACDMRSTSDWYQYPPGRDPGYEVRERYQVPGCRMKLLYLVEVLKIDCPRRGYTPP